MSTSIWVNNSWGPSYVGFENPEGLAICPVGIGENGGWCDESKSKCKLLCDITSGAELSVLRLRSVNKSNEQREFLRAPRHFFSDCFYLVYGKESKGKHDSVAVKLYLANDVALRALAAGFG